MSQHEQLLRVLAGEKRHPELRSREQALQQGLLELVSVHGKDEGSVDSREQVVALQVGKYGERSAVQAVSQPVVAP